MKFNKKQWENYKKQFYYRNFLDLKDLDEEISIIPLAWLFVVHLFIIVPLLIILYPIVWIYCWKVQMGDKEKHGS